MAGPKGGNELLLEVATAPKEAVAAGLKEAPNIPDVEVLSLLHKLAVISVPSSKIWPQSAITTDSVGRCLASVASAPMASTMAMPCTTFPNTTCLPFKCGSFARKINTQEIREEKVRCGAWGHVWKLQGSPYLASSAHEQTQRSEQYLSKCKKELATVAVWSVVGVTEQSSRIVL